MRLRGLTNDRPERRRGGSIGGGGIGRVRVRVRVGGIGSGSSDGREWVNPPLRLDELLPEVVDDTAEAAVPQPPQAKPAVGPPRMIGFIGVRPPARVEPPGVPRVDVQHPIRKYLIPMLLSEVPGCRRWRFDPFQVRRAVRVTVYTKMAVDITGFADPNAEIEILQRRQVVAANLVFRSHLVKLRDAGETEEVEAERGIGMQQNYGRG